MCLCPMCRHKQVSVASCTAPGQRSKQRIQGKEGSCWKSLCTDHSVSLLSCVNFVGSRARTCMHGHACTQELLLPSTLPLKRAFVEHFRFLGRARGARVGAISHPTCLGFACTHTRTQMCMHANAHARTIARRRKILNLIVKFLSGPSLLECRCLNNQGLPTQRP